MRGWRDRDVATRVAKALSAQYGRQDMPSTEYLCREMIDGVPMYTVSRQRPNGTLGVRAIQRFHWDRDSGTVVSSEVA